MEIGLSNIIALHDWETHEIICIDPYDVSTVIPVKRKDGYCSTLVLLDSVHRPAVRVQETPAQVWSSVYGAAPELLR